MNKQVQKTLLLIISAFALSACTDADVAQLVRIGGEQHITCYSGNVKVFEDISTGITQESENGIYYNSKTTGKYTQVYMDCIVMDK